MTAENDKRAYGSGFMYAEDLLQGGKFHTVTVEIAEVHEPGTLKSADGKLIDKYVIGFKGKEKRLCLAKTNVAIIHLVTGEQPGEGWIGKRITLQAREVKAFGANTLALRVIPPTGTPLRRTLYERMGKEAVYQPPEENPTSA